MGILCVLVISLLLLSSTALQSQPLSPDQVPKPLKPWVNWVLQGEKEINCPFLYNDGKQRRCGWPSHLKLDLGKNTGHFKITWKVYVDSWITLPGDKRHWPQNVIANRKPVVTLAREGRPVVRLQPGIYTIEGNYYWSHLPESFAIPVDVGLLAVSVNGKSDDFPNIDRNGQLWLKKKERQQSSTNTLGVQVFRRVDDNVPLKLITRIELNVAGKAREIQIGPILPKGFIPLRLESPIPSRLGPDGRLLLQLRTGRWNIELVARHPGELQDIPLPQARKPWPQQEIWVFEGKNYQRLVEVEGVTAIDPQQTNLPTGWKNLPTFRLKQGDVMHFNIIRRGDPDPEPDQLSINRNLWLDFDGDGYTISDKITGTMTQGWRLDTLAEMNLGQVMIDGQPRLITKLPNSDGTGVELRRGTLNLNADSRYLGDIRSFHAVGWNHDFQHARATLHLPPGWRLIFAAGVDKASQSWLQRWTLLDLFVVLIAAMAVARLWKTRWGILALVTFVLIWHEPGAPRYVWINILAAVALLQVLPEGKARRIIKSYHYIAIVMVVLVVLPFVAQQVRTGIYPQLEIPWRYTSAELGARQLQAEFLETDEVQVENKAMRKGRLSSASSSKTSTYKQQMERLKEIDATAKIQTGPGLPAWKWRSVSLQWNGPVEKQQILRLSLLSPIANRILHFFQALFTILLLLLVAGVFSWKRFKGMPPPLIKPISIGMVVLTGFGLFPASAEAEFPDEFLLKQLKERLMKPPACLPACAEIPFARVLLTSEQLTLAIKLDVQEDVAVPLPGHVGQWIPDTVSVDHTPATGLFRTPSGQIWLDSPKGQHWVVLTGPLPLRDRIQIPLPLLPRRVEVKGDTWIVEGLDNNGIPDGALQLSRSHKSKVEGKLSDTIQPTPLPPYLRVERTLLIGLDWHVKTRVIRESPINLPIVAKIPLLKGESVTTPGLRVKDHNVLVNFSPQSSLITWESVLKKVPQLTLTAPTNTIWNEVWRADISPIWHMDSNGMPAVYDRSDHPQWLPEWRPWPGESVTLTLDRPQGITGQTLTADSSLLSIKPGLRTTDVVLQLVLRSSQGGQHKIQLPPNVTLQTVTIDGMARPIRLHQGSVTLPIHPGEQKVSLTWRESEGMQMLFKTATVDLGLASVNARINVQPGQNRWILFAGGPRLGPAVLYWSILFVTIIVAFGLGRISSVPLKNWQWFLLLIGLSQISLVGGVVVVSWLILLGIRATFHGSIRPWLFNSMQTGLIILSLTALGFLFAAVQQGLLGHPEMQIAGNNSTTSDLNWYQDHSSKILPTAWLVSVPLLVYRLLMLAWALWLAHSLLNWLRWGWGCFSENGIWMNWTKRKKQEAEEGGGNPEVDTTLS
ncbi:MAG: hypothetical protein V3V31_13050 [Methylococcales bacterium]